jgi:hypothetical protein
MSARISHGARNGPDDLTMTKSIPSTRPHRDPRFALQPRQPRGDKLDLAQRRICRLDLAYRAALETRVGDPARFAAFMDRRPSYVSLDRLCPKCGSYQRRTRDRSCYACHLKRSGDNFERIKAGVSTVVKRSLDSHLDLLERKKAERAGEFIGREFDGVIAKLWPTGRLEITLPDGEHDMDINRRSMLEITNAISHYPQLGDALRWAGWSIA